MGLIEKIEDYFVKNSNEYKSFINKKENTSPEIFHMDGERKFSIKEQNFLRIYKENIPKRIVDHSNSRLTKEKNMINFGPTFIEEKNRVEIIPATDEQKKQYSKHIDGIEFTDMPSVDLPEFTKAQLNSVPDIIDGIPVNEFEKKLILLGSYEFSASNNWSSTFSIDENNKLISTYHDIDANNEVFEVKKHISKEEVMYAHSNEMEIKKEATVVETPKQVQQSTESNLSIDNIYGFSPTSQQKEDLKTGKGITGEIQGKNYYIMLSAQDKNKGSLQILSMEKAKELNLITDKNLTQKEKKHTGLRV